MVDITHALLLILILASLTLTSVMFFTRETMLGYPGLIFWALVAGQAYEASTVMWDVYYILFIASIGMVIFSGFAMYGLRERRDTIADREMDEEGPGEGSYIDEPAEKPQEKSREEEPRTRPVNPHLVRIRQRAQKRRDDAKWGVPR